jgi:hypothetical protein
MLDSTAMDDILLSYKLTEKDLFGVVPENETRD